MGPIVAGRGFLKNGGRKWEAATPAVEGESVEKLVCEHFLFEEAGLDDVDKAEEQRKVHEDFKSSLKLVNGRYEVGLPWLVPRPYLSKNFGRLR